MKPLVSVIIPTYNRLAYVQAAIESVLQQTYQDYEIIVIDDGSTDGTNDLIKRKYKDGIQYHWQANQGESKARNLGISLAHGLYLAFLDSDDLWHPNKLGYLVKALEYRRKKDRCVALVCSSVWLIDSDGKIIDPKPVGRIKNIGSMVPKDFIRRPRIYAPPSNALYVKEFVQQVGGFDEDIQYGEDWALLIKLSESHSFAYTDKPLTYYRIHNEQQRFPKYEKIEMYLSDHLKIVERSSSLVNDETLINEIKSELYESAGYWYFTYEDWQTGVEALLQAFPLNNDCLRSVSRVVSEVSRWASESAIFHANHDVKAQIKYFQEVYYSNLQMIWPDKLLSMPEMKRKIWAGFCHNLVIKQKIPRGNDIRFLIYQSFSNNPRFILSISMWKALFSSFVVR